MLLLTSLPAAAFEFGTTTDSAFGDPPFGNIGNFTELQTVKVFSSDVGSSFTRTWFVPAGTDCTGECDGGLTELPFDLKASATFTIAAFSSTTLDIDITIENQIDPMYNEIIYSFGFAVDPEVTASLETEGDVFDMVSSPGNYPGGFKSIDVCLFSHNVCSGGAQWSGLQAGESDSLTVRLAGQFGDDPMAVLAAFPIKWQGDAGSFQAPSDGGDDNGDDVPEPGTMTMLLAGLTTAAVLRRRRARRTPTL